MGKLKQLFTPRQIHDASRLSLGVCILTTVGVVIFKCGAESVPYVETAAQGLQWGAITLLLVTAPVVGRTARTGVERIIGTVAGGVMGYLTSWAAEGALWCVLALVIPFVGYLVGARTGYDYAGKLFSVTWAIVAPIAARGATDPVILFVTRVGGILAGILLAFLLSCTVWPRSASDEVVDHMCSSMSSLQQLTELTWGSMQLTRQRHEQQTLLQAVCDALAKPVPTVLASAGGAVDRQGSSADVRATADAAELLAGKEPLQGSIAANKNVAEGKPPAAMVADATLTAYAAMTAAGAAAAARSVHGGHLAVLELPVLRLPRSLHVEAPMLPPGPVTGAADGFTGATLAPPQQEAEQQRTPVAALPQVGRSSLDHVVLEVQPDPGPLMPTPAAVASQPPHQPPTSSDQQQQPQQEQQQTGVSPAVQQLQARDRGLMRKVVSLQDLRVLGEPAWLHAATPGSLASVAQWLQSQPSGAVPPSPSAAPVPAAAAAGPQSALAAPTQAVAGSGACADVAAAGGLPVSDAAAGSPTAIELQSLPEQGGDSSTRAGPSAQHLQCSSAATPAGVPRLEAAAAAALAAQCSQPMPSATAAHLPSVLRPPVDICGSASAGALAPKEQQQQQPVPAYGGTLHSSPAAALCSTGGGEDGRCRPSVVQSAAAARLGASRSPAAGPEALSPITAAPTPSRPSAAARGASPAVQQQQQEPARQDSLRRKSAPASPSVHAAAAPLLDTPYVSLQLPSSTQGMWDPFAAVASCPLRPPGDPSTAVGSSTVSGAEATQLQPATVGISVHAGDPSQQQEKGQQGLDVGGRQPATADADSSTAAPKPSAEAERGLLSSGGENETGTTRASPSDLPAAAPAASQAVKSQIAPQQLPLQQQQEQQTGTQCSTGGSEGPPRRLSRSLSGRPATLLSTLSGAVSWVLPRQLSLSGAGAAAGGGPGTPRFYRSPTLQEAAELLVEDGSSDATVLESLVEAAGGGRRADEVVTPQQRAHMRRALDSRCEDLVFAVHKSSNAVKESMSHACSELLLGTAFARRWYLPLLLFPGQQRKNFHMPQQQIDRLVLVVRRLARMTWAMHLALMDGFEEGVAALLRARFPANLLDKLHQAAAALLRDASAAVGQCRRGPALQGSCQALAQMRHHQQQYKKMLNTLLEISELQRHQIIDHVRRYVLPPPPPPLEGGSPTSRSARFSFDEPAVDEELLKNTPGQQLAELLQQPARGPVGRRSSLRRSSSSRASIALGAATNTAAAAALRRVSALGNATTLEQGPQLSPARPAVATAPAGAATTAAAAAAASGVPAPVSAAAAGQEPQLGTAAPSAVALTAAVPTSHDTPPTGSRGMLRNTETWPAPTGRPPPPPPADGLIRGFGSMWHLEAAEVAQGHTGHLPGSFVGSPQQQVLVQQQQQVVAQQQQQQPQQQQQVRLPGASAAQDVGQQSGRLLTGQQQQQQQQQPPVQPNASPSAGQQAGVPTPVLNLHIRAGDAQAATAADVKPSPRRVSAASAGAALSPQPSVADTVVPAALPHVDTPRLFFPDTREGYFAKMRWYSFKFLLEQLDEAYLELVEALTDLLPRMPGSSSTAGT